MITLTCKGCSTLASLIDKARVIIYDRNLFKIQVTGAYAIIFFFIADALDIKAGAFVSWMLSLLFSPKQTLMKRLLVHRSCDITTSKIRLVREGKTGKTI
jgi:hypothetical protein